MGMRDTRSGYGLVSRVLHWAMAVAIFAMFGLGLWMVGLTYYSPWYRSAPDLHKSVGLVLFALLVLRFGWRLAAVRPDEGTLKPWERRLSRLVHWGFYPLLLALMASGYLISTADGRAISVFGLVEVPAVYAEKGLEDAAGEVHEWLAWLVMALAGGHAAAGLKHHLIDRDDTLRLMLTGRPRGSATPPPSSTTRASQPKGGS